MGYLSPIYGWKIVWTFKTPPYLPHNLCSNSISASLSQFLNFSKSVRSVERREYARSFHSLSREEYGKTRDRRNFLIALPWPSFFLIEYYILSRKTIGNFPVNIDWMKQVKSTHNICFSSSCKNILSLLLLIRSIWYIIHNFANHILLLWRRRPFSPWLLI